MGVVAARKYQVLTGEAASKGGPEVYQKLDERIMKDTCMNR